MAKKIKITQQQLEEAMDIFVNKMGNENAQQALVRTQKETERQVGANKDVNYVVSNDQIKESKNVFTKTQILEARRNYLNNNSENYTKESFIKKQDD
jgi:hypothetical protein